MTQVKSHTRKTKKGTTRVASHYRQLSLKPIYDSRQSFYGKAEVIESNGKKTLVSYGTEVASIENGKATVKGAYSQTTMRHIKEFLKQEGFYVRDTTQVLKDYCQGSE